MSQASFSPKELAAAWEMVAEGMASHANFDPRVYVATWEAFLPVLRNCRRQIFKAMPHADQGDEVKKLSKAIQKLDGQEGQEAEEEAREAYEHLETTANRLQALFLLSCGVSGRAQSILDGKRASLRNQKALYNKLRTAHRQAEKAGEDFVTALEAYKQAALSAAQKGAYPFFAFLDPPTNPGQQILAARSERIAQIAAALEEANGIMARLRRISGDEPVLKRPGPTKRGRHANEWVNMAVSGLEALFVRDCGLSTHRAQEHTHALLHAAGIWANEDSQGFIAKAYQVGGTKNRLKTSLKKVNS